MAVLSIFILYSNSLFAEGFTGNYINLNVGAPAPSGWSFDAVVNEDNVAITLIMANGSVGNIVYTALGNKAYQRERVEVFAGGAVGVIENFKTAIWVQGKNRKRLGNVLSGVDRGYVGEMSVLIRSLLDGEPFPVSFDSYVVTTKATFAAMESLRSGLPVEFFRE